MTVPSEGQTPEAWRLFVAVPLPPALRGSLAEQLAPVRAGAPDGIRWTDPASWHVTLAFLGDTDPARVPDLVAALRAAVAPLSVFTASVGGLGAFPSLRSPRVIWLGVDGGDDLRRLASVVAEACSVDREQPFRAHVTIGRGRRAFDAGILDGDVQRVGQSLQVSDVRLMRSGAGLGGARHVVLGKAALISQPSLIG